MMTSSFRKHAGAGSASDQPTIPEPAFAERARTLMYLALIGSLSTLSRKQPGFPFGSVMPYGLDDHGRPIFLISTMAMHTQNLQADPRASLLVTQDDIGGDPLGASRVTLVGNVLPLPQFGGGRFPFGPRHSVGTRAEPTCDGCGGAAEFFNGRGRAGGGRRRSSGRRRSGNGERLLKLTTAGGLSSPRESHLLPDIQA
jgi:hypothetical protein